MGFHAEKYPLNEDNVVDAADPELVLLDGSGRVIGIEYETRDASGPPPAGPGGLARPLARYRQSDSE